MEEFIFRRRVEGKSGIYGGNPVNTYTVYSKALQNSDTRVTRLNEGIEYHCKPTKNCSVKWSGM